MVVEIRVARSIQRKVAVEGSYQVVGLGIEREFLLLEVL